MGSGGTKLSIIRLLLFAPFTLNALQQPEFWPGQRVAAAPPTPARSALASRLSSSSSSAPPEIVLLPGFGNDRSDYEDADYPGCSMLATLERRGFSVAVLNVRTSDWLKVFTRGVFSLPFWLGTATAENAAYEWYISAARQQIRESSARSGQPVIVVGHSAGGWLARPAVGLSGGGGGEEEEGGDLRGMVSAIVSLGAPHAPPPEGVFDPTRGVINDVTQRFSASFFTGGGGGGSGDDDDDDEKEGCPKCALVTVAGNGIVGDSGSELPWARASATAYATVLGGAGSGVEGDGTVPLAAAHLPGASMQLTLDAMHSVVVPGTQLSSTTWYGSERMVDRWLGPTLDLVVEQQGKTGW